MQPPPRIGSRLASHAPASRTDLLFFVPPTGQSNHPPVCGRKLPAMRKTRNVIQRTVRQFITKLIIVVTSWRQVTIFLVFVKNPQMLRSFLRKFGDAINERHAALCAERDTLKAEIEADALTDEQIAAMLAMFNQDAITGLKNATFDEKRRTWRICKCECSLKGIMHG